MYLKTLLILSVLLLLVDAEAARHFIAPDATYMLNAHACARSHEREKMEKAHKAAQLVSRANDISSRLARSHAELREEYRKATEAEKAAANATQDQRAARIERLRGIITLESDAFRKVLDGLGEFHDGRVPENQRKALRELIFMSKEERGKSSEAHTRKGIGYFQAEDLNSAIKMWEAAIELDPENKTAGEYKKRAEVVLERLKEIKTQTRQVSGAANGAIAQHPF
jgi:tetratricopeptide (TPR) repeat protein